MIKRFIHRSAIALGRALFGRSPRLHVIPFGPLKRHKIYMSFAVSPRMFFGVDEPWLAALIDRYVNRGDTVYDIGAHIGYTTLLFAKKLNGSGQIHSFEILPRITRDYLTRTVTANHYGNINIHSVGLANENAALQLSANHQLMANMYGESTEEMEECRVVTLTNYVSANAIPEPNVIKIDIEGAEIECLLGSMDIIKKCMPILIIEFHSASVLCKGTELLNENGYTLEDKAGNFITQEYLARLKRFHGSILCLPRRQ